ncbi:bifunctional nuclease family protein [Nanoarchaeota archaeon]|nr:MAG: bifunctional nuclease family protein [Nanoarchaeota archaeon]
MKYHLLFLILFFLLSLLIFVPREERLTGYERVIDVEANDYLLRLRTTSGHLDMIVSEEQVYSIQLALNGTRSFRPNTHDLFSSLLKALNANHFVTIDKLQGGTYYATLHISVFWKGVELDARPSDGVAIALRTGAPIFVKEELLENDISKGAF